MTELAELEGICEFIKDGTHGSPERSEEGIPVLSAKNVTGGHLNFDTDRFTTHAEHAAFQKRYSPRRDDLLLTIVGSIGRAALVSEERPLVFQRSVAMLRPDPKHVHPRYLYHATQNFHFQDQLRKSTNTSAQAGIYLKKLAQVSIPVPPIDEQRRIAARLDQADALIKKRERAIQLLDELAAAVFHDMFGDPVLNEKGWDVGTIADLGRVVTGNTPSRRNPANYGGVLEWIKPDILALDGWLAKDSAETLSDVGAQSARIVRAGSTLVTCIAGSKRSIGNAKLIDRDVAFNQQINAIEPGGFEPWYVYFLIRAMKAQIEDASTDDMTRLLNKTRFAALPAMLPPVDLTRQFGRRIDAIRHFFACTAGCDERVAELAASLQHQSFGGAA